ncbi:uncharacterized protein LOC111806743 [Cucurbita pepo subsp. pepo]|uniref:uncharacterized protein LOC111806743 n=1 Tax=Cucurbita pepo subsp. pepo TaxID=3664 RepID=UPI000C9D4227|nr:uncharacterized protein LOC111806743 [Cucurbita pepo subsp. pepo]
MASIFAAPPSRLNLTSRPSLIHGAVLPSSTAGIQYHSNAFPIPSFSYRNTKGLELRQRSFSITASNSSDRNSIKEENGSSKASRDAQGPPFLTILAGIFVFSLLLWMLSSAATSLIGLVVKLISTK